MQRPIPTSSDFPSVVKFCCWLCFGIYISCPIAAQQNLPAGGLTPTSPTQNPKAQQSLSEDSETDAAAAVALLMQRCSSCHGAQKQEGGLRLHASEYFAQGGDSGPVIDRNAVANSRLIEYVSGRGDSLMPPEGPRLTDDEVQLLSRWIEAGANWPQSMDSREMPEHSAAHWSFHPVDLPEVPLATFASDDKNDWCRNEIDRFIVAKLINEGLQPAVEADRRTLIKRLSYDLLGLPPTIDEIERFVNDSSPLAYEQLVDRLLSSPQFGERWAQHWLDRTQYGESSGCVIDIPRTFPWRWREWIIHSINRDLSFDQFTRQQIAGDLLPNADDDSRVAAGFLRNALTNHEAGTVLDQEHAKTTVDRTNLVGSTWLELTVGCAECHSHKYDPITQRDYYSLYAFFNNLDEQDIDSVPEFSTEQANKLKRELELLRQNYAKDISPEQLNWQRRLQTVPSPWKAPSKYDTRTFRSVLHAKVHPQTDGSLTVDGRIRSHDEHIVLLESGQPWIDAIRLELLPSALRFCQGPGRCHQGDCVLTDISITATKNSGSRQVIQAKIAAVETDYCQPGFDARDLLIERPAPSSLDSDTQSSEDEEAPAPRGWAVNHKGLSHAAVFVLDQPLDCSDATVAVHLKFSAGEGRTPARFRISLASNASLAKSPPPVQAGSPQPTTSFAEQVVPDDVRQLASKSNPSVEDRAYLKQYYQSIHCPESSEFLEWNRAIQDAANWFNPRGAESVKAAETSRETFVHLRGDYQRPGPRVDPDFPSAFKSKDLKANKRVSSSTTLSRLDLADWLTDASNPLTSRVAVNDVWQHLFGVGLVRSAGDFGKQGEPPTHPELLDWLAFQFVHSDHWSRKELIRRIVCSATYRQSSRAVESKSRDPQNLLLARQNRFRMDAEGLRDTVLSRAGLLSNEVGGPSYQPAEPLVPSEISPWELKQLLPDGHALYRRGLYITARRTIGDPLLSNFDAPSSLNSCPKRQRTNTPSQAITLLNDPLFIEAASSLGKKFKPDSDVNFQSGLVQLWRHCLGRDPSDQELSELIQLHGDLTAANVRTTQAASMTVSSGGNSANLESSSTKSDNAQHGASEVSSDVWLVIARTILNLDELTVRE